MDFMSIFFIVFSVVVLVYLFVVFKSKKRFSVLYELIFVGVYALVLVLFLFPSLLTTIEATFGLSSAINFFVYLSILVLFFLLLVLYRKAEEQRVEITKLVRETSYLKNEKKK